MAGKAATIGTSEGVIFIWRRLRRRLPTYLSRVALYGVVLILAAGYLLPFVWMVATSLKVDRQVYSIPPTWIPNPVRWQNYYEAMTLLPWHLYFGNTIKYALFSTVGTVLSSSLCAYGFSRVRWKGRDTLFVLCLATVMVPFQVRMIPLYLMFNKIGWLNSYRPLIIPSFLGTAYDIFLLRQFFLTVPPELSDAARIDGASELVILARIIGPLARPALAVVALFQLMGRLGRLPWSSHIPQRYDEVSDSAGATADAQCLEKRGLHRVLLATVDGRKRRDDNTYPHPFLLHPADVRRRHLDHRHQGVD